MPQEAPPLAITAARVVTPEGTLEDATLLTREGVIHSILPKGQAPKGGAAEHQHAEHLHFSDATLLPGFIDLHVHGGGGWRVGTATNLRGGAPPGTQPLVELSRFLATTGVTGYLPTLSTATTEEMIDTVSQAAALVGKDLPGANVLGTHLEGPYLNVHKKGAQRAELIRPPNQREFVPVLEAARGTRLYVTLAPEIEGATELITWLNGRGVHVSAGHTDATEQQMQRAYAAGLKGVTHLFNAMRGVHHREAGTAGWALAEDAVWVELISDGAHVNPTVMRLAIRAKRAHRVAVITDAGAFTGMPDGEYDEGYRVVRVANGKCTLEDGTLAESMSPMNRNCMILKHEVGVTWEEIATMTSLVPAQMLELEARKGSLQPGKDADLTVLSAEGAVLLTAVRGKVVHRAQP